MKNRVMRLAVVLLVLATVLSFVSACSSPAPVVTKVNPEPSRTPLPPEAARVAKQVNVSFSTYSKEWPVGWQWIDPDEKDRPTPKNVKKGVLSVTVPNGKDLAGSVRNAPRYVKPITGDFQIETHVTSNPTENYQGAGLLIYRDDNNYLRFERGYGGPGGGASGLRFEARKGDETIELVTTADLQTELTEVELKILRRGPVFTAFWRADEDSEWREAGEFASDWPETVFAGLVACNTARETTVEFAYIRLIPAPKR